MNWKSLATTAIGRFAIAADDGAADAPSIDATIAAPRPTRAN